MQPTIAAVLFDLYGTLVPRPGPEVRTRRRTTLARLLGCDAARFTRAFAEYRDERLLGTAGSTPQVLQTVARTAGGSVDEKAVRAAASRVHEWTRRDVTLAPDVQSMLRILRAHEYRLGLVSDCERDLAEVLPGTVLASLVDAITLSCVTGIRKPDRHQYAQCAARLEVPLEHCLYVGDGGSDELRGAKDAGATVIHFAMSDHNPYAAAGAWPGRTARSFADLRAFVGNPTAPQSRRDLHGSED
ncbi:HAD family hydrolase [Streptomyces sp. NPDC005322]|uniref:HAD family hydrolase n=1 Tax=Streptomyces sp. NPDC005322 TaxID=3157032 RepID=UPI0033B6863E